MVGTGSRRQAVLGVAISATEIVVIPAGATGAVRQAVRTRTSDGGDALPASLAEALQQAVANAGVAAGETVVHVALLAPLVELRAVPMPPVSDPDARALLARSASRHFLSTRTPMAFAIAPLSSSAPAAGSLPSRIVAAAPQALLDSVHDVVGRSGCRVGSVQPALAAWCLAVPTGTSALFVADGSCHELTTLEGGRPQSVRRFRTAGDEALIDDAATAARRAGGSRLHHIDDPLLEAARALANEGAREPSRSFAFESTATSMSRPDVPHRFWWSIAAALLVVTVSGVLALEWQTRRALASVRAERAALAPSAAATAAQRAWHVQLRLLAARDDAAVRWAPLIASIGESMPDDAFVTRLYTRGDTLIVEGHTDHAPTAYSALAASPMLKHIRASAPVRRESTREGGEFDRFAFSITHPAPLTGEHPSERMAIR